MRLMSFRMTAEQLLDGSKTVTRRLGWEYLKVGERVAAILERNYRKKGRPRRMGIVTAVSVRRERLDAIQTEDCVAEGFPEMTPAEFVTMFCKARHCHPSTIVTRIKFAFQKAEGV